MTDRNDEVIERFINASRELHSSYAINWTTALLALGMALFVQVLGVAARWEHARGGLSASGLESFLTILLVTQAFIVGFWLLSCALAWLGPKERDSL